MLRLSTEPNPTSNGEELSLFQRSEETIELKLGLGVTRFSVIESDGSEAAGIAFPIFSDLEKDVSGSISTGVNG